MHDARSSDRLNVDRRSFFGAVAATIAATQAGIASSAAPTQSYASFPAIKHVTAGVLKVGYTEAGPSNGRVVILLHGWPYDIHSFADVTALLAARGYRVLVPYLRGFGSTQFLSSTTFRNAQQSVVALDVIHFMDALAIESAIVGGFDWGSRTADIVAALWPQRCKALVSVSGYLITSVVAQRQPLPPSAELGWWYQYYFSTERGVLGYTKYRYDFNKLIWTIVSPRWHFTDATYDLTAQAFDNPDHVAIVIHDYRWRLGLAKGDPKYDDVEARLFAGPVISLPTVTIASDFDGPAASGIAYRSKFSGKYEHRILKGIGHNVPQEAPHAFAQAVVDVDGF
jgi:pimeloyl-ACP methyl ester carboxylesterase